MGDEQSRAGPLTDSRLRLVYVAGIALNAVALAIAASRGEWLVAGTAGVVVAYLLVRYRMVVSS